MRVTSSSAVGYGWMIWVFFLLIAENAITDLLLPAGAKQTLILLAFFFVIFANLDFLVQDDSFLKWVFWGALICACGSGMRFFFIADEGLPSIAKDFFQFVSASLLLKLFVDEETVSSGAAYRKRPTRSAIVLLLLALPLASFVLFVGSPAITFSFEDNQGHQISLLYGSLSSSIYKIGSLEFARMSFIFDEPGTCGVFFSLLSGCLYMREGKISAVGLLILFLGIPTLSLSFFIYLFSLVLWDSFMRFSTGRGAASGLVIVFAVFLAAMTLAAVSEGGITTYLAERIVSTSEGEHNRSEGNAEAVAAVSADPLGLPVSAFRDRELTSSGILVIAAYKGLFYAAAFSALYAAFVIRLRVQSRYLFGLAAALFIALITRNNFFNYSGPVLLLAASNLSLQLLRARSMSTA